MRSSTVLSVTQSGNPTVTLREKTNLAFQLAGYKSRIGQIGARVVNDTRARLTIDVDSTKIDSSGLGEQTN